MCLSVGTCSWIMDLRGKASFLTIPIREIAKPETKTDTSHQAKNQQYVAHRYSVWTQSNKGWPYTKNRLFTPHSKTLRLRGGDGSASKNSLADQSGSTTCYGRCVLDAFIPGIPSDITCQIYTCIPNATGTMICLFRVMHMPPSALVVWTKRGSIIQSLVCICFCTSLVWTYVRLIEADSACVCLYVGKNAYDLDLRPCMQENMQKWHRNAPW
jgi:hypothetical protein